MRVRVLRIIEYTGEAEAMEKQLSRGLGDGVHNISDKMTIRATTVGNYPEILDDGEEL